MSGDESTDRLHVVATRFGHVGVMTVGPKVAGIAPPRRSESGVRRHAPPRWRGLEPTAPRGAARRVAAALVQYLEGGDVDPARLDVDLDFGEAPDLHRRIWLALREVRLGDTISYGRLATRAGHPGAVRAAGQAVARNPFPILVPCHRVVSAYSPRGRLVAPGGIAVKARLLRLEGHTGVQVG